MEEKQNEEVVEVATEQPKIDEKVEKLKVKEKPSMRKLNVDDDIIKVDLKKPLKVEEDGNTDKTIKESEDLESSKEVVEETRSSKEETPVQNEEKPVLEEITDDKVEKETKEEVRENPIEQKSTEKPLPENIEKLIKFMDETGGSLEDYIRLNKDYSEMDNHTLLKEYYQQTKPHLNSEEIDFMMEDYFSYDEEIDEERDIKRKKLALKEQVAQAKQHLDGAKSKYYEEIQYTSKLTSQQQKAIDFFNRYNKESKEQQDIAENQHKTFINKTDQLFDKNFKGFEYNIGDKRFRFNVKNSDTVKETQSDINNFFKKFLNKNNEMEDAKGYHKSLFTANNADAIANHFYEQGKADALKDSVAKSKNINMDPRQQHGGDINTGGIKVRVLGDDSNDFKFKIKQNK